MRSQTQHGLKGPAQPSGHAADPLEPQIVELGRLAGVGLAAAELLHELRQPVFALKARLQLAMAEGLPVEPEELGGLLEQVRGLERLVERAAWSGRRPGAAPQPLMLGPIVGAAVELLGARARSLGRRVELRLDEERAACMGDPAVVHQVTVNIVGNAIQACRSTVVVRVSSGAVEVRDDGAGLLPEAAARLFEPFFTTKAPGEGTGLGLALSRRLIDEVGGRLDWESDERGACFRFSLPLLA